MIGMIHGSGIAEENTFSGSNLRLRLLRRRPLLPYARAKTMKKILFMGAAPLAIDAALAATDDAVKWPAPTVRVASGAYNQQALSTASPSATPYLLQ